VITEKKLIQTYGGVSVDIGQADADIPPEALLKVNVGGEVIFSHIADVQDVAKMLPFAVGLVTAFSRFTGRK
jgi:hypothetical protein